MSELKLAKYYKSRIHASTIIILRPFSHDEKVEAKKAKVRDQSDYKMLLMKRNENIVFGGFYAFSGGKVDE
jgi:hypothetical protein